MSIAELPRRLLGLVLPLFAVLALSACANIARLEPPPGRETDRIEVLGIPNARFWFDSNPEAMEREAVLMGERQAALLPPGRRGPLPPANYLALSGGGDNGAFGAGLMVG